MSRAGVPRHDDANYEQGGYESALRTAAFCFDPSAPETDSEYRRGIVNFLAESYAVTELPTGDRMEQVDKDLAYAIETVWTNDEALRDTDPRRATEGQAVAMVGNPSDGYTAVGPYDDFDAAANAHEGDECWVMTLIPPAQFNADVEPGVEHG